MPRTPKITKIGRPSDKEVAAAAELGTIPIKKPVLIEQVNEELAALGYAPADLAHIRIVTLTLLNCTEKDLFSFAGKSELPLLVRFLAEKMTEKGDFLEGLVKDILRVSLIKVEEGGNSNVPAIITHYQLPDNNRANSSIQEIHEI